MTMPPIACMRVDRADLEVCDESRVLARSTPTGISQLDLLFMLFEKDFMSKVNTQAVG